jgi:hypothetical protein
VPAEELAGRAERIAFSLPNTLKEPVTLSD